MGFLKDKGVIYEPADRVDLGPDSDEVYLQANVKGLCDHNLLFSYEKLTF